eukprot:8144600-Alexandrium_andersonii.AAC.1
MAAMNSSTSSSVSGGVRRHGSSSGPPLQAPPSQACNRAWLASAHGCCIFGPSLRNRLSSVRSLGSSVIAESRE